MSQQPSSIHFASQQTESPSTPRFQIAGGSDQSSPISQERCQEVHRVATELFNQNPDWVTFFREVLGLGGIVRQAYSTPESLCQFEQTEQYNDILVMLARLREKNNTKPGGTFEPTRVITVRLPKSLHESLRAEAHEKRTSMNKLCISKLLQVVDQELVPAEA